MVRTKRIIVVLLSFMLLGCASKSERVVEMIYEMPVVFIPSRPEPVSYYHLKGIMIEQNNKPYYAIEYNDTIEFRKWLEEIRSYIKEQQTIIEHYESIHKNKSL